MPLLSTDSGGGKDELLEGKGLFNRSARFLKITKESETIRRLHKYNRNYVISYH